MSVKEWGKCLLQKNRLTREEAIKVANEMAGYIEMFPYLTEKEYDYRRYQFIQNVLRQRKTAEARLKKEQNKD